MARDGASASAMKWQNRLAQGFSPGYGPNNKCALKGRPSGSVTHERPRTRFVFEVCHARPVGITLVGRHFPSFVPHFRNYGGQAGRFRVATLPRAKSPGLFCFAISWQICLRRTPNAPTSLAPSQSPPATRYQTQLRPLRVAWPRP
jgi:hypothetical protein